MRAKLVRDLLDLNEGGGRRRPSKQDGPSGGKARQLTKEWAKAVRHEAFHELLIAIVDEPVQEERVALREDSRGHL